MSREELANEINEALEKFISADARRAPTVRAMAERDLRDVLWDNKAGIISYLRASAQGAPGALLELLSNAYNEGFGEGMREQNSSKGGWPWNSRKQKYSALLDKALSAVTSTYGGEGK